jgi:hypothetical protein
MHQLQREGVIAQTCAAADVIEGGIPCSHKDAREASRECRPVLPDCESAEEENEECDKDDWCVTLPEPFGDDDDEVWWCWISM